MTRRKSVERIRRHGPVTAETLEALARLYGARASDDDLSKLADSLEADPDTRDPAEHPTVDETVRRGERARAAARRARRK